MTFFRGTQSLSASLMAHTGAIVRFRTSQLQSLPAGSANCRIVLPHGEIVDGHFNPEPRNPNITGAALRRWILATVPRKTSRDVLIEETAPDVLVLLPDPAVASDAEIRQAATAAAEFAREPPTRRRESYERWERDPALRKKVLSVWPAQCQIVGCSAGQELPPNLREAVLEVHHLNHVSAGGDDSPMNLCLICANHHRLIHRAQPSVLEHCDESQAVIKVGDQTLTLKRELGSLL